MLAHAEVATNSDQITVLTCYKKLNLTKIYNSSGVKGYDDAKQFAVSVIDVSGIRDVSRELTALVDKPHKAIIRGAFVGEAKAIDILPPKNPGMFQRKMALFPDVRRHWLQFDIDKFKVEGYNPALEPVRACDEFICAKLPAAFHGISYHWMLTSSAGMVEGTLKARLTFWLSTPYSSEHIKAWAEQGDLPVDKAIFHPVQLHYTAAPLFKEGTADPVPVRCGFEEGLLGDEVDLAIDPLCVLKPEASVRALNKEMPNACEKPGWIGAFCRAFSAADVVDQFLVEVFEYQSESSHRLNFILSASGAAGGAFITDDGYHIANKHDSDPFKNRAANSFDLVRQYKFGHLDNESHDKELITGRPSYKAMVAWCKELDPVKIAAAGEGAAAAEGMFEDLGELEGEAQSAPAKDWRLGLDINDRAELLVTMHNISLCLLNLMPGMYYDQFKQRLANDKDWPWRNDSREWNGDFDLASLRKWLEKQRSWAGNIGTDILAQTLLTVAHDRGRHPIRIWLKGLKWDGVTRVDTLLIRAAGVEDTFFHREAIRKTIVGAVKRVMEPGCKFDYVLTFIGKQGIRKSGFWRALASEEWFADDAPSMTQGDGKAFKEYLGSGKWIVEMAEMSASKKADHDHVKSMISAQVDSYRPAYGRYVMDVPRQCVLVQTTNDDQPLRDRTGNRRTWAIAVPGVINTELVAREREQLFAEAVAIWEQGEALYLSPEAEADAEARAAEHTNDSGIGEAAEVVRTWLDGGTDEFGEVREPLNQVCALQIAKECVELRLFNNWGDKRALAIEAMKLIEGWTRTDYSTHTIGYGKQKIWRRNGTWAHR